MENINYHRSEAKRLEAILDRAISDQANIEPIEHNNITIEK